MPSSAPRACVRFGDYELDLAGYALRRSGIAVKLGRQPMDLLMLLVERRHQLVSRQEIIDRLWGKDVFVDVEMGINTAISKVRQALRDSADAPAFVETVPGRGYRFIADVTTVDSTEQMATAQQPRSLGVDAAEHLSNRRPPSIGVAAIEHLSGARRPLSLTVVLVAAVIGIAAIGLGVVVWRSTRSGADAVLTVPIALAVLPFESLGDSSDREYLAAGLTEETSASLAQIDAERLRVKGRTLSYKGTTKTAAEIGRELTVDYLVEGTVRTEGGRVRVTVTLLRARDQEHLWSHTYEREPTSVLGLQRELSAAITQQIRVRLSQDRPRPALSRQTGSPEAYDAYLRGRYLEGRRTPATNVQAIREYERALTLDANYALAWARLALTYSASTLNGDARPLDVGSRARDAAARAIALQTPLAEVHLAAGYVAWLIDWNWPAAEQAFRRATEIDPSSAEAWRGLGHVLSQMSQHADAETAMQRARELEPLEPAMHALSSQTAFQARHLEAAVDHARQAIAIDPDFWVGHMQLGQAYAEQGKTELALEATADAARLSGQNSKAVSLRGYVLAKMGRTMEARAVLRALDADARERYVPPYAFALVHAGLDERDAAFDWLERAYAVRDVHLVYVGVDSKWDAFRQDPRLRDLLARCGFGVAFARLHLIQH
jgi:TolB-like protein/DNA-binding winged helix-turn-helix (wHTH) protein/Flp pilus assembly protein TadD